VSSLLADLGPLRESASYRRLLAGQSLSLTGSFMTRVAVAVQVYALTGSSSAWSAWSASPPRCRMVVLGLAGGSVADSVDRRRLVLGTGSALAVLSLALAGQAVAGWRSLWLLYLLVAGQSALNAVQAPASRTFAPRLLGPERQAAVQALGSLSSSSRWSPGRCDRRVRARPDRRTFTDSRVTPTASTAVTQWCVLPTSIPARTVAAGVDIIGSPLLEGPVITPNTAPWNTPPTHP